MDGRRVAAIAGLLLALATMLGAFGAHALREHLAPEKLQVYETAVRYQFFHALGLLGIGIVLLSRDSSLLRASARLVLVGVILFCGSLYLLTFGLTFGIPKVIGILTPLGGLALISGWIDFGIAMLRR